jgi:hypothetical protein
MKRTFQPSKRKRRNNTDLEKECLLLVAEKYWQVEELKGEIKFLFHLNQDIKNK